MVITKEMFIENENLVILTDKIVFKVKLLYKSKWYQHILFYFQILWLPSWADV